jgi:hypothetical protein
MTGCDIEGEDVALFNNVNELVIIGKAGEELSFDRTRVHMFVHLHRSPHFTDVPSARLMLKWYRIDEQGNKVALSETRRLFFDAVSEGDYFARAFLDVTGDSEPSRGEPLDVWRDDWGEPKVVRVREESRWKLEFVFDERVGRLPTSE